LAGISDAKVNGDENFSECCDLYGFNAATGLLRLAQSAIKAGSVVRISGTDAVTLRKALASRPALGECPEEGFGRFRLDNLPVAQAVQQPVIWHAESIVGHKETLCQRAQAWAHQFGHALAAPSNSQWGDFRARIQAAQDHEGIFTAFTLLDEASKKFGGNAWKSFTTSDYYKSFREQLIAMPLADALALLEYFVRWQHALSKSAKEKYA